jgi:hypothetical protein
MNHEFQFLSFQDFKHFSDMFSDYVGSESEIIPFDNMREIIYSFPRFNRTTATEHLDELLKKSKSNHSHSQRLKENELYISKFFNKVRQI